MKAGKTSFAAQAPNNLLLAFERGYNGIAGIHAQDITKWSEFKTVLKQLASDKAKEMYHTVTIDTVGIAWELCEKFIIFFIMIIVFVYQEKRRNLRKSKNVI